MNSHESPLQTEYCEPCDEMCETETFTVSAGPRTNKVESIDLGCGHTVTSPSLLLTSNAINQLEQRGKVVEFVEEDDG